MKKFITAVMTVSIMLPVFAFAQTSQTADLQSLYQSTLKQVIALLEQEVAQLETQLASVNAAQNASSTAFVATSSAAMASSAAALPLASGATATVAITAPSSTLSVTASTTSSAAVQGLTPNATSGISVTLVSQAGKMPSQEIGAITIGASNSGPIEIGSLKLTFSGNGYAAGSSTFLNTVVLKDPNNVNVASSFGAIVSPDTTAGTVTWTFPASAANPAVISSGERLTLQLWAETDVIPGAPGVSESLSATVQNPSDLTFYDGADPAAIAQGAIPVSTTAVPITVASLSWGLGM